MSHAEQTTEAIPCPVCDKTPTPAGPEVVHAEPLTHCSQCGADCRAGRRFTVAAPRATVGRGPLVAYVGRGAPRWARRLGRSPALADGLSTARWFG